MSNTNPLDILKRLDVKQNVTIRVIDEPTGKVVQEHVGHNAATNSLLTGIAHYLMGDGVLNQAQDTLSMWVPQYISLGTMGLTSQESETINNDSSSSGEEDPEEFIVPKALGYTPVAPTETNKDFDCYDSKATYPITLESARDIVRVYLDDVETTNYSLDYSDNTITFNPIPTDGTHVTIVFKGATDEEKELNAQLRFTEYINQAPGFGADGYDNNSNNNREWFGLGYPYNIKPNPLFQDFYTWDGSETTFVLSKSPLDIISITLYPGGVINQDVSDTDVERRVLSTTSYSVSGNELHLNAYPDTTVPATSRIAVIYTSKDSDAANCELIQAKYDSNGNIVPLTLRSKITYRDLVPEIQSEVPNTLDVIFSAFVSTGALSAYRGDNDYIYITEAGLWSSSAFSDSGDNGMLAGYRIMPSDDEVNILGAEKILDATGEMIYELVDDNDEPLDIISIDSVTCDSTDQKAIGHDDTTEFQLVRNFADIISVTIDDTATTDYTIDENKNTIIFDTAPVQDSNIVITYTNTTIPSDCYQFHMEIGATVLIFENGYIPTIGQNMIIIYRSGNVSGTWKDMTIKENREKVQKSIIRIGVNQVAQIVWKIQLGGLEQLNGLRYLYPSQYPEEVWNIV